MTHPIPPSSKSTFYAHLPNLITFLRILITPLTYFFIINNKYGYAFLCFAFAGFSDGIDGYLARRWNVVSKIGRILDPIADKALMFITFVTLGYLNKIPLWLVLLVIGRDILILLCGCVTFLLKLHIHFTPIWSSKVNTFLQILLVGAVLICQTDSCQQFIAEEYRFWIIMSLFFITGFTTLCSGIQYGIYYLKQLHLLQGKAKK